MKIIGIDDRRGQETTFIVGITKLEIAQIVGAGYPSSLEISLEPGQELKIGEKWRRLNKLDSEAKKAADSIPESLRMMAGLIEMAGTSLLPVADEEFPEVEND